MEMKCRTLRDRHLSHCSGHPSQHGASDGHSSVSYSIWSKFGHLRRTIMVGSCEMEHGESLEFEVPIEPELIRNGTYLACRAQKNAASCKNGLMSKSSASSNMKGPIS